MKKKLLITALVSLISASSAFADVKVVKSELNGTGFDINGIVNIIEPLIPVGQFYHLLSPNEETAKQACKLVGMDYHSFYTERISERTFAAINDGALKVTRGTQYIKVLSCKAK